MSSEDILGESLYKGVNKDISSPLPSSICTTTTQPRPHHPQLAQHLSFPASYSPSATEMLLKGKCNYSSPVQKAALGIMLTFLTLYKGILVICLCPPFPPHSPFPMPLRLVWQPYRTACHCLSAPRLFPPLQESLC